MGNTPLRPETGEMASAPQPPSADEAARWTERQLFDSMLDVHDAPALALLRAVLESVPDALMVHGARDVIVNTAARELLGAKDDPSMKRGLRELDGTPLPSEETPFHRARRTGERQEYILRVGRADSEEKIHKGTIVPVVSADGDVFAAVTVFREVTDECEQLYLTEEFLKRLLQEFPLAVALADPGTTSIRFANEAFLRLVGYSEQEVVGATRPYPWWVEAVDLEKLDTSATATYERLFRRKSGELVPVELKRSLLHDADGKPCALLALFVDLSERRAFEQQLIQNGKLASIGELAAGVAHEINNPLFAILGLVEFLIADAEPGTKRHDRLSVVQETALEIKEIVRALLDFARERTDELVPISLADVAKQTVVLMRRISAKKDVEIVERYHDHDVTVFGSANQLKQIFVNLISNAHHAMPSGGTMVVEVGREGDTVWAEVRDDGLGISADVLPRIFEPFFTTRRDCGGTGLGLSVSFGIAQGHGGSLTVDSSPGSGSAFRLRLPAPAVDGLAEAAKRPGATVEDAA